MRKLLVLSVLVFTLGSVTSTAQASGKRVYTGDWITATRIVGHYYGIGTANWLISCSSSEGGHGGFVWFGHYDHPIYGYTRTPGGWMQFKGGTFYSNMKSAFRDAERRGLNVHPKARSYYQPLGQAVVAAYIYRYYGSGQWTGSRC